MKKHIDKLFVLIVALTAYTLFAVMRERGSIQYALYMEGRPFVYRVLIKFLAFSLASITSINAVNWTGILMVLSAIGLFYALLYLYNTCSIPYPEMVAFLASEAALILILPETKIYDISTVMFFAMALGLIANENYKLFFILFPLVTFNRETSFLLTGVYFVFALFRIPVARVICGALYQAIVYLLVRAYLVIAFASTPGYDVLWNPRGVLSSHAAHPIDTISCILCLGSVLFYCLRGWNSKPLFLRAAFLLIPAQIVLYLLVGSAFEFRVFAESLPIVMALAAYPLPHSIPLSALVRPHLQEETE